MIVQRSALPGRRLPTGGADRLWSCLARRGMLHSECEAVDLFTLASGAQLAHRSADGVEQAVFVVSGRGELHVGDETHDLATGRLALIPARTPATLRAGTGGLQVLTVRVLPHDVIAALPARVPELPLTARTPL